MPSHVYAPGATFAVFGSEAYALHASMLATHLVDYASDVRQRLLSAAFLSSRDYLNGQRARRFLRNEVDALFGSVDCLLCPTLPVGAPPVKAKEVTLNGRTVAVRSSLTMFTRLFNLTGHPALSLPCGHDAEGLPLAFQLVGRAFDEATVLRLGHAYQIATEWHEQRPPVGA
jgi:aspartyl-tRNA(Asn)/glutamyl-tRNA(Gln) amidotransferase subunit A